jgi:BirA family biotin operon repressor/biotin-[acetyl-CoA-carboxylase] ligase
MRTPANHFHPDDLRASVKPFRLHFFPRLRSTNDHAARLRRQKRLFAPAIVLTARQTAGRGRGKNTWWSGDGSLTVTFAMPVVDHLEPHQVPLIAGLAVRQALCDLAGSREIRLKWPNDLVLDGGKVAGLLCERVEKVDLIGVGVNVNVDPITVPRALRRRVASLLQITDRALDMNGVVSGIARAIHARLARPHEPTFGASLREYDRYHALTGLKVAVTDHVGRTEPLSGVCVGLDGMGRLLLRDRAAKLHRVVAGHVSVA